MSKKTKIRVLVMALGIVIVAVPAFVFSSHKHDIYVDDSAKGKQDGSYSHPYDSIGDAMDHADDKTEIHVSKGTYHENVTVKKGVKLFGHDADDTIIEAKDDNRPAVFMKDNSKISDLTVKNGEDGVKVDNDSQASIINCTIKDNDSDGIHIDGDSAHEKTRVTISNAKIKNNDRAGIFSGRRRVVLIDSEITGNGTDGIDFQVGTSAWIAGNYIAWNGANGMNLKADGANIWTKHNDVRNNKQDGVVVYFFGTPGHVNLEMSKIVNNGHFGVARVQPAGLPINEGPWGGALGVLPTTELWGNAAGTVSGIISLK